MPNELIIFIGNYGYIAIFLLVFSQEIGIPNPVPNELVLMFAGFLSMKGILSIPLVIFTVILADFVGTIILYTVFYFFGDYIVNHLPRWIPLSKQNIDKFSKRISQGGKLYIYMGRLTPFIRGYTSVVSGLLNIKPRIFLPIALISASTWSILCVMCGRLFGNYFMFSAENTGNFKYIIISVILITLMIVLIFKYIHKRTAI